MCGIVGIIGHYNLNLLPKCLKQLQNRGYDSAGIGVINDSNKLGNLKFINKKSIDELDKLTKNLIDTENNGIAHTRWATHGGITIQNCHPHHSMNEKFNLVHNGIIENYEEMYKFLISKNFTFSSDTDTEVIVNLIQYYHDLENNIEIAISKSLSILSGTWALLIQCVDNPDIIYAIKKGSPLLVGKTNNFTIVTSEVSGFNNMITNYHELKPEKLYKITKNTSDICFNLTFNSTDDVSLGKFKHWTLKEIYDQQNIITKITNNWSRIKNDKVLFGGLQNYQKKILSADNLIILGCGTSYNASLYARKHLCKLTNFKNVIVIDASNFDSSLIPKKSKNVGIFVSQSGETKDLFQCFDYIRQNTLLTIGVINVVDSLIARTVDCGIYLNIGKEMSVASTKVFLAQSLVLSMLAIYLSKNSNLTSTYISDIKNLQSLINSELDKEIDVEVFDNGFILSNTNLFPIALEASLKFKEITYSHIEPMCVNSLKHGPLALVSGKNFVNIVLGNEKTCIQEIEARNGKVINIIKDNYNIFSDLIYIIYLQKYNYYLSIEKNINPDFPRNLAKVVTV
jgi:glucosamine--fructose-6-phosphate aminotransferase (isomerizing)